jgi:hypothetical protein
MYQVLTTAIVALHFGWLGYVVLGGFLAWRWRGAFWPHLVAVVWGVALIVAGLDCPLTAAEDWSRRQSGEPGVTGFVDRYVEGVIYPDGYTGLMQTLVGLVIAVSWIGALVLHRSGRVAARLHRP